MVTILANATGGVGGWLATRLVASGSAQVQIIARGAHGAAIRDRGLRLRIRQEQISDNISGAATAGALVELAPGAVEVYTDVAEAKAKNMQPADFVILCVKSWQVEAAAAEAVKLLAPGGCLVTTQNGVQAPIEAAKAAGHDRVLAGICKVLAFVAEPGLIEMEASPARFHFGEAFAQDGSELRSGSAANGHEGRAERLAAAFAGCAGVTAGVVPEPGAWAAIWEKANLMCCLGPVGALCRAPMEQLVGIPETRQLLKDAMAEVAACSAAAGHRDPAVPPAEFAEGLLLALDKSCKPGTTTSTTRDVLTGRPSELYELTGGIRHAGRSLGVPTPTHDLIFAALLPQERRARGESAYTLMGVPGGSPHVQG
ncbi:unnamed protein product [Polarella glacialis]|uniref:2-dehydropantoate 2-reductase n=1 Tax=Polarella glacialis TaxID=89957 RepID=A0A813FCE3_POLGL|nr:unnamed protein product [Polarella glacialis]